MKNYSQQDFNEIPSKNLVVEQLASDPSSTVNGRTWYNTATFKFKTILNGVITALVSEGRQILAGTGLSGGGDLSADRTLSVVYGSAAGTAAQGNDARLSDARTPTGAAGGDLASTYPNPTIGANKVVLAKMGADILESGVVQGGVTGTAATTVAALRRLGFTANDALAGTTRLDQIAIPTTNIDLNSQRILNLQDPISPQDGATKAYVDLVTQGLDAKVSVRAATTANIATLAGGAPNVVDGVTLTLAERVLVKAQTTASQNGIYQVSVVGTGANGQWTRVPDMDSSGEVPGAFVFVEAGTTFGGTGWVANVTTPFTINTTAMPWTQFSGAGTYTAGAGLTLTGTSFAVNVDNSSIEINANILRVKAGGVTNAMLAGSIDLATKVTGTLPIANGGTNANTAAGARAQLGAAGSFNAGNPALTAGTWSSSIAHNLNVLGVVVRVREAGANGEYIDIDVRHVDSNNIQLRADVAVLANALTVACTG